MNEVIKAGTLDRAITIQHYSIAKDDFGQEVKTWVDYLTNIPAGIVPQKGGEDMEGKQLVSTIGLSLKTRFVTVNPSATMRIFYNSRYYNIVSVEEIGRRVGWLWRCELRDNTDGTIL